jgi:hypothetical protein
MKDKGCPGERLQACLTKVSDPLCASQWFWGDFAIATLHVRVVCFDYKTGSYRQSRTP